MNESRRVAPRCARQVGDRSANTSNSEMRRLLVFVDLAATRRRPKAGDATLVS